MGSRSAGALGTSGTSVQTMCSFLVGADSPLASAILATKALLASYYLLGHARFVARSIYAAAASLTAMLQLHGCNPPAFLLRRES